MKIGVCANYDRWGIVAAAGYDYVEGNFSKIARATEEEFEEMKEALADNFGKGLIPKKAGELPLRSHVSFPSRASRSTRLLSSRSTRASRPHLTSRLRRRQDTMRSSR